MADSLCPDHWRWVWKRLLCRSVSIDCCNIYFHRSHVAAAFLAAVFMSEALRLLLIWTDLSVDKDSPFANSRTTSCQWNDVHFLSAFYKPYHYIVSCMPQLSSRWRLFCYHVAFLLLLLEDMRIVVMGAEILVLDFVIIFNKCCSNDTHIAAVSSLFHTRFDRQCSTAYFQ